MTFQQPPNQGNQPPAPPPPPPGGGGGQFGPPPGGGYGGGPGGKPAFDPKTVNPLDWAIIGAAVLIFIFSFIDYYTVSVSGGGFSASASGSAWHGFFGWFAVFLALGGGVAVAIDVFAPHIQSPVPRRLGSLALFAVGLICVIIALFVIPIDDGGISGVDTGHGFGYWASLVLFIVGLVAALMRFQQTGGTLPGAMGSKVPNIGQHGPQGGIGGSQRPGPGQAPGPGPAAPPPSGYQAPPPGSQPPPPQGYTPPPGQ